MVASFGVADGDAGRLLSLSQVVEVTVDCEPELAAGALLRLLSGWFPGVLLGFRWHAEDVWDVLIDKRRRL